ncbi:MAG: amidohydrolase [Gammaproteobacteria bacterium]|nr:amidohydrolase [Gammaproteobacteria bacterium]MBT5204766.1 amidohydrolase [Gammaproteobacteria bacterium]MBT5601320.1 amidohydrolase [Gammaproteobacteria bacterium]MBT6244995.1 amidohydrolase [Gammaproteobacteria bacterium]
MHSIKFTVIAGLLALALVVRPAIGADWQEQIEQLTEDALPQVIDNRHWFHAHPELGNREFNTARKIVNELNRLGFDDIQQGVAHTGVVAVLKGGMKGPTVALRADMDGLPVSEKTGLPFASKVTTLWQGTETGVMHACGHDAHMAILLGVAEVLSAMKARIPGNVKFIFQPAEEGPPPGEEGGAQLMIKEGVLSGQYAPGAIFGLHVFPGPTGAIMYKSDGFMAAADFLEIEVIGKQAHGSMPWGGVDPITAAAQVINALQTVVSRQLDISQAPAVVTIGSIQGGNRGNIIPEKVKLTGTIRTLDPEMRKQVQVMIKQTVEQAAKSMGAKALVSIDLGYPVTFNDAELTQVMSPVLQRTALDGAALVVKPYMGAEDFSFYANEIPGLFFALGVAHDDPSVPVATNHSPYFYVNDRALPIGIKALSNLAMEWLHAAH